MTTLDSRARAAARAVHDSVDSHRPVHTFAAVARRAAIWRAMQYSLAGAAAVLLIVVGAIITGPSPESDVTDPTATSTPEITVPETPIVPDEVPQPETVVSTTIVEGLDVPAKPAPPAEKPAPAETVVEPDTTPPSLVITSPADGAHLTTNVVTFLGATEPGAIVTAGNGKYEAHVDAAGSWSIQLVIFPGANGASFVATDAAGNETVARITVYLDGEEPPKEGEDPPEVAFTASQVYGSCAENPPYDVFNGTAQPGTVVAVTSPYGGGETVTDGEGNWSIQVFFPEAPYGGEFTVKAKDHTGQTKSFPFVSYAEA